MCIRDSQRTQRITGSAFRIPLQTDWRSRQTKQRLFLTGQSWRVLKSGYTAGSPEQGFRRYFAGGVNQSLISSARRLWLIRTLSMAPSVSVLTLQTLRSKFEFSFVASIHFHQSSGEKLIKYLANSSCVIMSLILITTLFYKVIRLQGEI